MKKLSDLTLVSGGALRAMPGHIHSVTKDLIFAATCVATLTAFCKKDLGPVPSYLIASTGFLVMHFGRPYFAYSDIAGPLDDEMREIQSARKMLGK